MIAKRKKSKGKSGLDDNEKTDTYGKERKLIVIWREREGERHRAKER